MKKILIILLMILTLSLVACSNKYERIYNLDNEIELVEIFSEEQSREYFEECKKILETIDYITYKGYEYCKDHSLIDDRRDSCSTIRKREGKFQKNSDIQFYLVYEEISESEDAKSKYKTKCYGKAPYTYFDYGAGKKFYFCNAFNSIYALEYFIHQTFMNFLPDLFDSTRYTIGKDIEGNVLVCMEIDDKEKNSKYIVRYVYNDYKLIYYENRQMINEEVILKQIDIFTYDSFKEIKENLEEYKHNDYSCGRHW